MKREEKWNESVQIFVTFVYIYSRSNDIDRRRKIDQFRGGIVQVDHAQGHEWVRGARLEFEKGEKEKESKIIEKSSRSFHAYLLFSAKKGK